MALSHRPVDRIMRKAGAERVSEAAARELVRILEVKAIEISKLAVKYAQHAGRKTVKAEDIKLAAFRGREPP
ncbi:MAG: NFYB/HAP3 family transcription factor subunit [Candidatus Methanofastidiosia archaeon]